MRMMGFVFLAACGGIAGDWDAVSVSSEAGESLATGILEIDLDGETLLEADFAGDGPSGSLRATGSTDRGTGQMQLVGTRQPSGASVTVGGPCAEADRELVCELDVEGEAWTWTFRRENDLLDSPLD